jgi:hypothetical protein
MLGENMTELELEPIPDGDLCGKIVVPWEWVGRRVLCKLIEEDNVSVGHDVFNQDVNK